MGDPLTPGQEWNGEKWVEATGDTPKVAPTRDFFAAIYAGLRTAEEYAREQRLAHDALAADLARLREAVVNVLDQCLDPQVDEEHASHGVWDKSGWKRVHDGDCPLCEIEKLVLSGRRPE